MKQEKQIFAASFTALCAFVYTIIRQACSVLAEWNVTYPAFVVAPHMLTLTSRMCCMGM